MEIYLIVSQRKSKHKIALVIALNCYSRLVSLLDLMAQAGQYRNYDLHCWFPTSGHPIL